MTNLGLTPLIRMGFKQLRWWILASVLYSAPVWAIEVGQTLSLGAIQLIDGSVVSADEWSKRPTIVQVWATWCPYCKGQNKNLHKLQEQLSPHAINILTISVDKNKELVDKYMAQNKYRFPVAMMTPALKEAIGKRKGIPELYVLDRLGRVIQKDYGQMLDEDFMELARYAKPAKP